MNPGRHHSIRQSQASSLQRDPAWLWILGLAVVQAFLYREVASLSRYFEYHTAGPSRPIVPVLCLLAASFVIYLAALAIVVRRPSSRRLILTVVGSAILFRCLVVASTPIQEVDIYRYVWDGAVCAAGVNPYQFSPQQVLEADTTVADRELASLVARVRADPVLEEILRRVHFGFLPSVYPPVSQWHFAAIVTPMPHGLDLAQRLTWMKSVLVMFDLATLGLVCALLQLTGRNLGWCLAYGWCPLLIKEVANSGHLDAIAVFLMTLAIYLAVLGVSGQRANWQRSGITAGSAITLGLAVGAKLFPIVLVPWWTALLAKRLGRPAVVVGVAIFCVTVMAVMWPMLPARGAAGTAPDRPLESTDLQPTDGLEKFLRGWEMNDFAFLLVVENLKPDAMVPADSRAWFCVVPHTVRRGWVQRVHQVTGLPTTEVPFMSARILLAMVFVVLALRLAGRAWRDDSLVTWLRSAFLTLAWFWLLCPTQNPWYWTWTLPLLPFARARSWLFVSGLTLIYYLRFWLIYHWPEAAVVSWLPYDGTSFFDLVVTWIEFGPWYLVLFAEWWRASVATDRESS